MHRIRHGSRWGNAVALTFDDGPSEWTEPILERLTEAGATATFFVVGSRLRGREALIARIAREGHEIGSHSWSHRRLATRPLASWAELVRTSAALRRISASAPRYFRPPYAEWSTGLGFAARLAGLRPVTWDVDPRDWEGADPARVAHEVIRDALPGSIVLLHDGGSGLGAEALPAILAGLRGRGLVTSTLSGMLLLPSMSVDVVNRPD